MKHKIEHELGLETAIRVSKAAFASYAEKYAKYEPKVAWKSETEATLSFKVKLIKLDGQVEIYADRIEVNLDVPLVLRVFKDKALSAIDREVRLWLEKARTGEI